MDQDGEEDGETVEVVPSATGTVTIRPGIEYADKSIDKSRLL